MTVAVALDGARSQLRELPDELTFVESPPGMAGLSRFDLHPLDESGFLFALRSLERDGVRLFVIPPQAYFEGYAPEVSRSGARCPWHGCGHPARDARRGAPRRG